jgi:hypothetical protein
MFYLFQVTHGVKTKNSSKTSNAFNTWLSLELWTAAATSYGPTYFWAWIPDQTNSACIAKLDIPWHQNQKFQEAFKHCQVMA